MKKMSFYKFNYLDRWIWCVVALLLVLIVFLSACTVAGYRIQPPIPGYHYELLRVPDSARCGDGKMHPVRAQPAKILELDSSKLKNK